MIKVERKVKGQIEMGETKKVKVFLQVGKAEDLRTGEVVDVAFIHYRDEKGQPIKLQLRENPEVVEAIRNKIYAEFGPLKIKAESNLRQFDNQPCIEVVIEDGELKERNRFRSFSYAKAKLGLQRFDNTPKKSKLRRVVTNVSSATNAITTLGEVCPELGNNKGNE